MNKNYIYGVLEFRGCFNVRKHRRNGKTDEYPYFKIITRKGVPEQSIISQCIDLIKSQGIAVHNYDEPNRLCWYVDKSSEVLKLIAFFEKNTLSKKKNQDKCKALAQGVQDRIKQRRKTPKVK